ncbi:hypothetical protein PTQ19_02285 [Microbacterium esteraromaticum]|uniref:hypothetical protein n=1 Tax=Microbacterium esteraromaticum TaxID=57043 RepID=UPI002367DF88|nr:hypothetical protein [Microbacterium esteraromaticum]WDH79295.1 hypothetical protein PTQ19_02285 [Microbacterium esteraromaticum]
MTRKADGMPHHDVVQDLLIEQMRRDLSRVPWWKTLWGRFSIASGALLIVGLGVAAVVILEERPVNETSIVHCMERPRLNADGTLSGAAVSIATPDGVVAIEDAEAVCTQMWESGAFGETDPLSPSPAPGVAPQEFTICVTDDGEAAVAPGLIECSVLKLHPHQPNVPLGR